MSIAALLLSVQLSSLQLLNHHPVPSGTPLHIRLTTTVGTYVGRAGDPVTADLIVAVTRNGDTMLPAGAKLSGVLKTVQRVGFGVVHETAALEFAFDRMTLPDGSTLPLSSVVRAVDLGRETVAADGSIRGQRKTASLAYRVGGYIRTAIGWEMPGPLALWTVRMLLVQIPEPELYYPAGVEMTLELTKPLLVPAITPEQPEVKALDFAQRDWAEGQTGTQLAETENQTAEHYAEKDELQQLVGTLPVRAHEPALKRPADLVNFLFIGTHGRITRAFLAAGWQGAHRRSLGSSVRQIRAVADGSGYRAAPMSTLLVDNEEPDMSWQKSFNDPSKRHHIRIWKQPGEVDGQEIWVGAATRDIDYAFMRPGHALTHKIESNIDLEREKVLNDLLFTQCVDAVDSITRPGVPGFTHNATGDVMVTDANLLVVHLNDCATPRLSGPALLAAVPPVHGNGWQRFARREVLTFRNEMMRENLYWRSYEGVRWGITALVRRHQEQQHPAIDSANDADTALADAGSLRKGFLAAKRTRPPARRHMVTDLLK